MKYYGTLPHLPFREAYENHVTFVNSKGKDQTAQCCHQMKFSLESPQFCGHSVMQDEAPSGNMESNQQALPMRPLAST